MHCVHDLLGKEQFDELEGLVTPGLLQARAFETTRAAEFAFNSFFQGPKVREGPEAFLRQGSRSSSSAMSIAERNFCLNPGKKQERKQELVLTVVLSAVCGSGLVS